MKKMCLTILFLFYIAVLFKITVFRSGFSFSHLFENGTIQIIPFVDFLFLLKRKEWFLFCYLFFGNIIWFVPFGSYLIFLNPKMHFFQAAMAGFCFSFLIEVLQYVFGTGISEMDDLILNTLGVLMGAGMVKILRRMNKKTAS